MTNDATCRTCGGTLPNHKPSIFDPQGIGSPGHKMTNKPKDASLDELREQIKAWYADWNVQPMPSRPEQRLLDMFAQQKQSILNDVLKLVGPDDKDTRGSSQNPDNPRYHTRRAAVRNELRAELRQAITNYGELE